MKTATPTDMLKQNILLLQNKREEDFEAMKEQYQLAVENLKPINLIKSAFKGTYEELTESPDIKDGIGKAAIGLTSGYLLKNLLFRSTANPIMKLAGLAFQTLTTNLVAKNTDTIKSAAEKAVHFIQDKFKKN